MTTSLLSEVDPGVFTIAGTEHEIRVLLRRRDAAEREIAVIDAAMLPLRKRYAAERGEFLLPSVQRLRRELGV